MNVRTGVCVCVCSLRCSFLYIFNSNLIPLSYIFHRRLVQGNSQSNLLPVQTKDLRKFTASVWFVDRLLVSLRGTRPTDQTTSEKRTQRILLRLRVSFHFTNHNRFPFQCNLLRKVTTTTLRQRGRAARTRIE